eukprot:47926-Prorocentrum_lima.AAC.1
MVDGIRTLTMQKELKKSPLYPQQEEEEEEEEEYPPDAVAGSTMQILILKGEAEIPPTFPTQSAN